MGKTRTCPFCDAVACTKICSRENCYDCGWNPDKGRDFKPPAFKAEAKPVKVRSSALQGFKTFEKPSAINWNRVRELYDQGLNDRAISAEIGCTASHIQHWRQMNRLPSQRDVRNETMLNLYRRGLCDREIADEMGCNRKAVTLWRERRSLTANRDKLRNRKPYKTKIDYKAIFELNRQGLNDCEIARRLHCSHNTVYQYRKMNGLPTHKEKPMNGALELYQQGFNDRQIAEKLGYDIETVRKWRNRYKLRPIRASEIHKMQEAFMKCYKERMSDTEIAETTGRDILTVRRWRVSMGLKNNTKAVLDEKREKYLELYKQGMMDREAAEKLELSISTVLRWRKALGLSANRRNRHDV